MSTASDPAVLEAFDALAERLAIPEMWTQEADARNTGGAEVDPVGASAQSWCLMGAVECIRSNYAWRSVIDQLIQTLGVGMTEDLAAWNDDAGRVHQDVVDLIASAKAAYLARGAV